MKYFKNTELARIYKVSEKSVRNWVQATNEGKLDLQLHKEKDKWLIANTSRNTAAIEKLVAKGKKYKNTRGYKVVSPTKKFYDLYSPKQIVDIMSNLDIYRESPLQYTYFNSGARQWDQYATSQLKAKTPNSFQHTVQLLDLNLEYLDRLLEGCNGVNIIDIGVGNALPVRGLIEHFTKKGLLKRYIGLDISRELLDTSEHNIRSWFGDSVNFEGYIRDINYERFDDLLIGETFSVQAEAPVNLVLFLGGTFSNFRAPDRVISTIHDSMGKRDMFIFSKTLDTEQSRRYFDMVTPGGGIEFDLVLKLLNVDESLYELEQFFDDSVWARKVEARLNVALAIKFELNGQEKVIEFSKGESILLLRMRHQSVLDIINQFDANGFDMMQAARSKSQDYLLSMFRIKTRH